jgi:hypothetical protein
MDSDRSTDTNPLDLDGSECPACQDRFPTLAAMTSPEHNCLGNPNAFLDANLKLVIPTTTPRPEAEKAPRPVRRRYRTPDAEMPMRRKLARLRGAQAKITLHTGETLTGKIVTVGKSCVIMADDSVSLISGIAEVNRTR